MAIIAARDYREGRVVGEPPCLVESVRSELTRLEPPFAYPPIIGQERR